MLITRDTEIAMLYLAKRTMKDIGRMYGISKQRVDYILANNDLKHPHTHTCLHCGKVFQSNIPTTRFCSGKCATKAHYHTHKPPPKTRLVVCALCGKEIVTTSAQKLYCSRACFLKDYYSKKKKNKQ
jgi:hypothetical protein